jgi:hypothetical protein
MCDLGAASEPRQTRFARRPQILTFVLAGGWPRFSLKVDRSPKGSPQPWIVDPCDVLFENGCARRIIERGDPMADFAACAAKEARRRWPPSLSERVDFIGHGKYGRLILRIVGDGETQHEQQPFSNSTGPPILRTELLHLTSRYLGDRVHFCALRRNGGAMFTHHTGFDH